MNASLLTILIPYHAQRETLDMLKRQLNYYSMDSRPLSILIALSGDKTVILELEQFITSLNNPNIELFKTDETEITNKTAFYDKVLAGLKLVKTEYVTINGADDLVILDSAFECLDLILNSDDIAAVKGDWLNYHVNTGSLLLFQDSEILQSTPIDRIKEAMKDRDSIFYVMRKSSDFLKEFESVVTLTKRAPNVFNSYYHIEHFMAIGLAACGKLKVIDKPWRLVNSHDSNSSSHTDSSFARVENTIVDENNFMYFKSYHPNMAELSYSYYCWLWFIMQVRGISVRLKQIIYNVIHRKVSLRNAFRITSYWVFHQLYIIGKKLFQKNEISIKKLTDREKETLFSDTLKNYFVEF